VIRCICNLLREINHQPTARRLQVIAGDAPAALPMQQLLAGCTTVLKGRRPTVLVYSSLTASLSGGAPRTRKLSRSCCSGQGSGTIARRTRSASPCIEASPFEITPYPICASIQA
jgi:hypothetical protein